MERMSQMEQLVRDKTSEFEKVSDELREERQNERRYKEGTTEQVGRKGEVMLETGEPEQPRPEEPRDVADRNVEVLPHDCSDVEMSEEIVVGRDATKKGKGRYVDVSDDEYDVVENDCSVSFDSESRRSS